MIGPVEINFECKYLQDGLVRQSVFNACQLNASQTIKRIERERKTDRRDIRAKTWMERVVIFKEDTWNLRLTGKLDLMCRLKKQTSSYW